jgi:hypothetical protein
MKQKLFVAVVLVMAVVISQCSKETDEDAIRTLIEEDTIWFNPNTVVDSTADDADVDTIIWWRGPQTHNDPIIDILITGDSAWVAYSRDNSGDLIIWAKIDSITWQRWLKDLSETAMIRATFLRTGTESDEHRGWELNSISLAEGRSDESTVRIDSIRITTTTEAFDLVITEPLSTYFDLDSLITFQSGEPVTLTLYTNVEDGHAFLHTFILAWPFYIRLPFTNIGDGVYQGTWNAQLIATPRFAIFDLMSHSTLYTQDQPYDFNGWLLPYMIGQ